MSQQTKITKVLEQLKNAEDKHVETVDALGTNIGVYMADISNSLNEMTEVMMLSLTNTSDLLEDMLYLQNINGEILFEQLLDSRESESNGIANEEEEREDQQFKEGLSDKVEDIHDELKKDNKEKKKESKGFFKSLMGVGAMMLGSLLKLVLAPLKGLSKLFGKGGMLAKVFGKGGTIATIVGKFGKLTGLTALFGRLAPMLSILGKVFVPLGLVITGFKVISAAIEDFMAGGDPASIISAGIGAFVEFFTFGFLKKDQVKGAIEGPIRSAIDFFVDVFHTVSDFVSGTIMPFVQNTVIPAIQSAFSAVVGFFQDHIIPFVMETLVPILKDIFGLLFKIFQDVVLPIAKVLFNLLGKIFKLIFSIVSVVFKILTPVIKLVGFLLKVVIEILKPIIAVVGWIVQGIGMVIGFVVDIITFLVDIMSGIIDFIMSPMEYISSAIEGITNFLSGVVDFISSAIMGAVELAKQVFLEPFNFIVEGIGSIFGFIKDKIDSLLNDEDSPLFGLGLGAELKKGKEARAAQAALIENYSEDRHRRVFQNLKGAGVLDPHVEFEDTPVQWGDFNKDWSWDDWTSAAQQVNAETPTPSMANQLSTPQQNAAQQIDTSDLDRASREAMAQISTQVVTNVQGGSGGGGGAIIAPSATRMNESSFRTQTQNGMVPAMEG